MLGARAELNLGSNGDGTVPGSSPVEVRLDARFRVREVRTELFHELGVQSPLRPVLRCDPAVRVMKSAFNSPETAARVAAGLCIEVLIRALV